MSQSRVSSIDPGSVYVGAVFDEYYRTARQLIPWRNRKLPPHLRFSQERVADLCTVAAWLAIHGHFATRIGRAMGRNRNWVSDRIQELEWLLEPVRLRVTVAIDCE
jgi:hypothetical protein